MAIVENFHADWEQFYALRKKLRDALIEKSKEHPGKSYEGEMSVEVFFTGIYDNADGVDGVTIKAHCYLIGPARHYEWTGRTFANALDNAESAIDEWTMEAHDELD